MNHSVVLELFHGLFTRCIVNMDIGTECLLVTVLSGNLFSAADLATLYLSLQMSADLSLLICLNAEFER